MSGQTVAKVTISIPQELLELADKIASEKRISRSRVIAQLLEKAERERIEALMVEGYKEMAEENSRIAEEFFTLDNETMTRDTEWHEGSND